MAPELVSTSGKRREGACSILDAVQMVTCPVLVGREAELETLESYVAAARGLINPEERRVDELIGEIHEQLERARTDRAEEARRRNETERAERQVRSRLASVEEYARSLVSDPFVEEVVVFEAIVRLLRALASDRGLLVVTEDVHWADRDTLAAVEYAAGALSASRVCWICTERPHMTRSATDVMSRLTSSRLAQRVELERLRSDDVRTMARFALGAETLTAPLVDLMERRAEGLPFFVCDDNVSGSGMRYGPPGHLLAAHPGGP